MSAFMGQMPGWHRNPKGRKHLSCAATEQEIDLVVNNEGIPIAYVCRRCGCQDPVTPAEAPK